MYVCMYVMVSSIFKRQWEDWELAEWMQSYASKYNADEGSILT